MSQQTPVPTVQLVEFIRRTVCRNHCIDEECRCPTCRHLGPCSEEIDRTLAFIADRRTGHAA